MMGFFRGKRKYTGFDKNSSGKRAGVEKFKDWVVFLNGGKITCKGTWVVRPMRGKSSPSVHGTGRAIDFGYTNREDCLNLIAFLERNWEAFGVEFIADYNVKPYGRGWRVDRLKWSNYSKGQISGGGESWANWIHVELSNEVADDAAYFDAVFKCLLQPVAG